MDTLNTIAPFQSLRWKELSSIKERTELCARQLLVVTQWKLIYIPGLMHYRNGRPALNGDKIVRLSSEGKIEAFGVLHSAVPGNDYCNGNIAVIQSAQEYACLCDCLHIDDIAEILTEKGLKDRPAGK
jgi:hypothetical protein